MLALKIYTVIVVAMLVAASVWLYFDYQDFKRKLESQSPARKLKLTCCFCERSIPGEITIGKFHHCEYCDSEIQALKPKRTSKQCRVGKWRSYIA